MLTNKQIIGISSTAIAILIVALFSFGRYHDGSENNATSEIAKTKPVVAKSVSISPVVHHIPASGELKSNQQVSLKAEIDGKIFKIHLKDGADVKKGDVLIEFESTRARATLKEAEAMYSKAVSEYEPAAKLASKGVGPELQAKIKKAEMEVCAARVDQQKDVLSKHTITAPFDGKTSLVDVNEGEFIMSGQNKELIKIVNYYPLKVDFNVPESHYQHVSLDQKIKVLVLDFTGKDREYDATIVAIDPCSEKSSRSVHVRAVIESSNEKNVMLKPGMFVKLRIPIRQSIEGILIPESAIEASGDSEHVYIVSNGTAKRVTVVTGVKLDGNVEIITGLKVGDVVVTDGINGLFDGCPVKVYENGNALEFSKISSMTPSVIDDAEDED